MKRYFLAVSMLIAAGAAQADNQPAALKKVEGFLAHNIVTVSNVTFSEGERQECTLDSSGLVVTRCRLEGASLELRDAAGQALNFPVATMAHYRSAISDQVWNHYIYRFTWSVTQNGATISEPATLTIISKGEGSPADLQGYLSISELDVKAQFRGRVAE